MRWKKVYATKNWSLRTRATRPISTGRPAFSRGNGTRCRMKSKSPGSIHRGEIWWAALDPVLGSEIAKTRPCVVLSRDILNERRRTVVVVPLSSLPTAHPPIQVAVHCGGKPAVAVVDQIRAISKQRLQRSMGALSERDVDSIARALQQILEL